MSMFQVYMLAAPFNAFIWCAVITLFLKKMHLKSNVRVIVTYLIYLMISFATCAGGNGLFNINMEVFSIVQFVLYAAAGLCVCIGLYCFYERGNIGRKIEAKRNAKKGN